MGMEYYEKHYAPIIGGTVTGFVHDPDSGDNCNEQTGLDIMGKNGKRYICWIMCDPEGNGPGHMDIIEIDEKKGKVQGG